MFNLCVFVFSIELDSNSTAGRARLAKSCSVIQTTLKRLDGLGTKKVNLNLVKQLDSLLIDVHFEVIVRPYLSN